MPPDSSDQQIGQQGGVLAGRVALVTGAGRGIGRALAVGFAAEGAEVVAISRTTWEIEAVAQEIERAGGLARARTCDVSSEDDVVDLSEWVSSHYRRLDVLVNNAALRMIHVGDPSTYEAPVLELGVEEWDRMIAVNLRGPFLTCKFLGQLLRAAGRASVINISSGGGGRGDAGRAPYCASKFGLEGLSQSLAAEWQPHNIAVNTLTPGASVLTDAIKMEMRKRDPRLRFVRPEVMVPPAVYLALQDGAGVTGQRLDAFKWVQEHGLGGWERWQAA